MARTTYTYPRVGGDMGYDDETYPQCPACGSPIDYCQGHGEIGDPAGFAILQAHDAGDHSSCDPDGCDERPNDAGHASIASAVILLGIAATGLAAVAPMIRAAVAMLGGAS